MTVQSDRKSMSSQFGIHVEHAKHPYAGCIPALATMHRKERAIALPFKRHLGLPILPCSSIDTDALGTFTGEIPRKGTMLETAAQKARLACATTGRRLGVGSEGSFGPHRQLLFVPADVEVVVLYDRQLDLTITEAVTTLRTNFGHLDVQDHRQVDGFLTEVGFPRHAVIVSLANGQTNGPFFKGLIAKSAVEHAMSTLTDLYPGEVIRMSTDMRAHFNPTRMAVIRSAASRLARRVATLCPKCQTPGFGMIDVERGLSCSSCMTPTSRVKAFIYACKICKHTVARPATSDWYADPKHCPACNP